MHSGKKRELTYYEHITCKGDGQSVFRTRARAHGEYIHSGKERELTYPEGASLFDGHLPAREVSVRDVVRAHVCVKIGPHALAVFACGVVVLLEAV